ncbi:MAG: hypothetical protein ACRC3B_14330, partial [Bacteroidia bacterium]
MTKKLSLSILTMLAFAWCTTIQAQQQKQAAGGALVGFEENRGQMLSDKNEPVPDVFFKAHVKGLNLYLTKTGITYVLIRNEHEHTSHQAGDVHHEEEIEFARIDMQLTGASITRSQIRFEQPLPGFYNYYLHHCPQGITNVQRYANVIVKDIYPGIDWLWHADETTGLKYDFVVHPGASPDAIKMLYKWADVSSENSGSSILLRTPLGELREGDINSFSTNIPISSNFVVNGNEVRINTTGWDQKNDLIIDPPLALLWGTYIGGDSWEK